MRLNAENALGGDLAVGDTVDVIALAEGEVGSVVIVRGALVGSVSGNSGGVGSVSDIQLNLDVPNEAAAQQVLDAHARGGVALSASSTITFPNS